MILKSISVVIMLSIFVLNSYSQQRKYLLQHDFLKDKSDYYKISESGDTTILKRNKFKGKAALTLQVTNYNPFVWKTEIETIPVSKEEDNGISKFFNPLLLLKQIGGGMIEPLLPINLSGSSRGSDKLSQLFIRYKVNYNQLAQLMDIYSHYDLVVSRLLELKYDFKDPESFIKYEADISIAKLGSQGPSFLDSIKLKAGNYDNRYRLLKSSIDTLYALLSAEFKAETFSDLDDAEKELWNKVKTDIDSYYQPTIKDLTVNDKKTNRFSVQADSAISLYREIIHTRFEYSYKVINARDVAFVKIRSTPNRQLQDISDSLIRYIPISRKKGLQLTNSFGVAFSVMNEYSYYAGQDSIIRSTRANLFNPLICSFVQFYSGNSNGIKWGGNLGAGISMSNTDKGLSFLSGLSMVFGKHDEIVLSAGVAGSRISILGKGLKVGDKFNDGLNAILPTEALYRIGGFFSFSFNVSAFTSKQRS